MEQRISQLNPMNAGSFDPATSWLECIVADLSSPTGFSTVRVRANSVGGAVVGLNQIAFGDSMTGALTSDMTFYRDPSTGDILMSQFYFNSSGAYPYFSIGEPSPDLTNYALLKAAGTLSINGTSTQPITFKKSNTDLIRIFQPSTNVPLLDFNNVVSNQAIKLYDKYSVGLAANKLLLNTDTSGAVSIGRYDGTAHYPYFVFDNNSGIFKMDNVQSLSGSGNIAVIGGTNFLWGSGGGLVNAELQACYSNHSDFHFGNNYGIEGAGRIAIGDNSYLGTYAGGVSNYLRFARLGGNYNLDLQKVVAPPTGGFMFVQGFPYKEDVLAYVGKNDKLQFFTDKTWDMPIGTSQRSQFDTRRAVTFSPVYDSTEIDQLQDIVKETRRVLKSVICALGNNSEEVVFDDTNDYIYLPNHNLVARQRVRFISFIPSELNDFTWYFICDTPIDSDNFQITASIGGLPLSFTSSPDGFMEIEFSGMNLLGE